MPRRLAGRGVFTHRQGDVIKGLSSKITQDMKIYMILERVTKA